MVNTRGGHVRYERKADGHSSCRVCTFRAYPRRNAANALCRAWVYRTFPGLLGTVSPTYGPDGTSDAFDKVKTKKTTQLDIGAQYSDKRTNAWVSAYVGRVNDFSFSATIPTMRISARSIISTLLSLEARPVSAIS